MGKRIVHLAGDKYENAKSAAQILEAIEDLEAIALKDIVDRNRPYDGQPWTDTGDRGRTLVEGVTMRDVRDCFILALFDSQPYSETPAQTLDDLDLENMSLEAISQNMSCWVERYMGIYPNVPDNME